MADPGDGANGVGPRPQVPYLPQELERLLLLGERIPAGIAGPKVDDALRLQLHQLSTPRWLSLRLYVQEKAGVTSSLFQGEMQCPSMHVIVAPS